MAKKASRKKAGDKAKREEVCGFASCSNGKEGRYVHGEIDSKSREKDDAQEEDKDDAQEEDQEEIFQALIQTTVPEVEYRRHHRWQAP
jgi:hypothetical protein